MSLNRSSNRMPFQSPQLSPTFDHAAIISASDALRAEATTYACCPTKKFQTYEVYHDDNSKWLFKRKGFLTQFFQREASTKPGFYRMPLIGVDVDFLVFMTLYQSDCQQQYGRRYWLQAIEEAQTITRMDTSRKLYHFGALMRVLSTYPGWINSFERLTATIYTPTLVAMLENVLVEFKYDNIHNGPGRTGGVTEFSIRFHFILDNTFHNGEQVVVSSHNTTTLQEMAEILENLYQDKKRDAQLYCGWYDPTPTVQYLLETYDKFGAEPFINDAGQETYPDFDAVVSIYHKLFYFRESLYVEQLQE